MLQIDGTVWLLEHATLSHSHRSIPRLGDTDDVLGGFLEEEGRGRSLRLLLIVTPKIDQAHRDGRAAGPKRRRAYENLRALVQRRLVSIPDSEEWKSKTFEDGGGNTLDVVRMPRDAPPFGGTYSATGSSMARSVSLSEQFYLDIAPIIR